MEMLRHGPNDVASYLADRLMLEDFFVIDVGCSGGIDLAWRSFGERLAAIGIDPNRSEIVKLTEEEPNPRVRYFAAFAGVVDDHPIRLLHTQQSIEMGNEYSGMQRLPWDNFAVAASLELRASRKPSIPAATVDLRTIERSLEKLAAEVTLDGYRPIAKPKNYAAWAGSKLSQGVSDTTERSRQAKLAQENNWSRADLVGPECRIDVSILLDQLGVRSVDFIKIDIDGCDYEVLFSLDKKLREMQVLGVALEVNFVGSGLPHHHTFHNTDRLMRDAGFALFGLTVRTYTSAALPSPYLLGFPAQSISGRPLQGDALYLRDFSFQLESAESDQFSWEKIAKLIALFAMFNLPDQAAETALRFRDRLDEWIKVDLILDMLAAQMQEGRDKVSSYQEYMAEFVREDPWFFDAQYRQ